MQLTHTQPRTVQAPAPMPSQYRDAADVMAAIKAALAKVRS